MITFHDLPVGTVLDLPPRALEADEIVTFAREFDPQDFHLDGESAQAEAVGGLIASGWHTCAMVMRMFCDGYLLRSTSQGAPEVEEVRWLIPVRPGDVLSGTSTVRSARVSRSRPDLGLVVFDHEIRNQHGEPVLRMSNTGMFALKAGS